MADLEAKQKNENKKNENVFVLKNPCKIGEKEYQKGESIEVKSEKGIEYIRATRLID